MLKQLEKEAEEDEEIYDQLACWCETNDKEKTKAIADAESKIEQLTTAIEDLTAGSARLNTEIKNLEKEVAENQEALDQATEIRQKELAEFDAEPTFKQSYAPQSGEIFGILKQMKETFETNLA